VQSVQSILISFRVTFKCFLPSSSPLIIIIITLFIIIYVLVLLLLILLVKMLLLLFLLLFIIFLFPLSFRLCVMGAWARAGFETNRSIFSTQILMKEI